MNTNTIGNSIILLKRLLFLAIILTGFLARSQNDTIVLSNGNMLVGEIKGLEQGIFLMKTRYSDKDFNIKWHEVEEIRSSRYFITALNGGKRYTSTINSLKDKKGKVTLDSGVNSFEEDLRNIIFLDPIGKNRLSRLTVDIDVGLTLTKSNNYKEFTTNISANYAADKWKSSAFFNSVLSRQDNIEDLKRIDGNVDFIYFIPPHWFVNGAVEYLSNDEQKLDSRNTYRAGAGYFFKRTNEVHFGAGLGAAYIFEKYSTDASKKNSSELYAGMEYEIYDIGDFSVETSIIYYYSLSETGRYRVDLNAFLKYDLPLDFYVKTSLNYDYDSQPVVGASSADYIFQLSFGWEWN